MRPCQKSRRSVLIGPLTRRSHESLTRKKCGFGDFKALFFDGHPGDQALERIRELDVVVSCELQPVIRAIRGIDKAK